MPEIRTVSRAEGRQAAGASAFDSFHERRSGGIDLDARRARIDAQVRPVAGAEVDDPDNWRAPTPDELADIRERHQAASGGESHFSRWRSRISGVVGGLLSRRERNDRDSSRPSEGNGNVPPPPPLEAPPTGAPPPEEPDDQPSTPNSTPPPRIGARLEAIIDPNRTGRRQEPSGNTNANQDPDAWRVPDQPTFDAMRDRRAGASGNNTPGTTPSGRPIPRPPIPEGATTPETGSWRGRLWERVNSARERVWDGITGRLDEAGNRTVNMMQEARDRIEQGRDWAEKKWNSPLGRVVRKLMEDVAKDVEKGKRKGRVGWGVEIGKLVSLYGLYKGQELAGKLWERKWDIATGAAAGAALRTVFISVGWEAYLAKAAAAGAIGGLRRGWSELDTYDKPEGMKARLNIVKRIRALDSDQQRDLATKMLVSSGLAFGGSLLGIEFMERTGLGDSLHNALGLNKLAGAVSGLGESIPKGTAGIPGLAEAADSPPSPDSKIPNQVFGPKVTEIDSSGGGKAVPGTEDVVPGSKAGVPPPGPDGTEGTIPGKTGPGIDQGKPGDIGKPEGGAPPAGKMEGYQPVLREGLTGPGTESAQDVSERLEAISGTQGPPPTGNATITAPVTTAVGPPYGAEADVGVNQGVPVPPTTEAAAVPPAEAPLNPVDQAIEKLPPTITLPQGSTPWAIAEQLLKEANPNAKYTPADIMAVDKILCQANGVAVPEWGIEGKILATRLPAGMNFVIDDDVKKIVKQIASK